VVRHAAVVLDGDAVVAVRRLEGGLLGQGELVHPRGLLVLERA
jgi:hypothetical protein